MSGTTFLALLALYAFVAMKVEEWTTISLLGFKLKTPLLYLDHPGAYVLTRWTLFTVVAIASFNTQDLPWYAGIGALFLVAFSVDFIAHRRAFNSFRRVYRYLAEAESDPNELADIEAGARITNSELKARLALARKYAT